jgi:hypothetical protein
MLALAIKFSKTTPRNTHKPASLKTAQRARDDATDPQPGHLPQDRQRPQTIPRAGDDPPRATNQRSTHPDPPTAGPKCSRKEVIQPHLPVRLPCYDFVPIAGPTFDGSPPNGLGHRLRVLPTFMT